ncbi:MAG: hypothetical protein FWD70_00515 [Desulfuromonadales bacterium]|nr:hypothetical protein [Desulfuromonadales bacterium]
MKNFKAVIGLIIVFILGGISGSFITYKINCPKPELKGSPKIKEEAVVTKLSEKLNLNNQQRDQVKGIVHENFSTMQYIKSQTKPQIKAVIKQGQGRIFSVLTPEQQKEFQKIIDEYKQKHEQKQNNAGK